MIPYVTIWDAALSPHLAGELEEILVGHQMQIRTMRGREQVKQNNGCNGGRRVKHDMQWCVLGTLRGVREADDGHMFSPLRIGLAGMPTTVVFLCSTERVTTAPAPMIVPSAIVTPPMMDAPTPMSISSPK